MSQEPIHIDWVQSLAYVLFAAFGGLMGYLMRTIDKGLKVSYTRAFVEAASAGFVGALVTLICAALTLNALWSGVIVGVCGWLGATASIRLLETFLLKKLGITQADIQIVNEANRADPPSQSV